MLPQYFVLAAVSLNLLGSGLYVRGVLAGRTLPNRVTWLLWAAVPVIAFGMQVANGVGLPALMTLAVGVGPLAVSVASFLPRRSRWSLRWADLACAMLSAVAVVAWLRVRQPGIAMAFFVTADLCASIPTVRKAFVAPRTENGVTYALASASAAITLATIDTWTWLNFAFPTYILLISVTLCLLTIPRRRRPASPRAPKVP